MYRTVIVEDDPLSQEALKDILQDFKNEYEIVGIYSSVEDTLAEISKNEVDLVLLDMELTDGQGFDVLKRLENISFEVIIITMHDSFMLEAIKHSALDYLMKPIDKTEISLALGRFKVKMEKLEELKMSSVPQKKNRLVIPSHNGLVLVDIKELVRLESEGSYTKIFAADNNTYMMSKNLGYYENQLEGQNFIRVHHKHLINMDHVKSYTHEEGGKVVLSDNSIVEVSRRKKDQFLQKLDLQ